MKNLLVLIILVFSNQLFSQRFDWATTGGATGIANSFYGAVDIARDPQGNIYTFDYSNHAQQCQGDTLQPYDGITAYVYKFNSQGELLFMNRVGELGGSFTPFNIETDDAGSIYILGQGAGNGAIIINEDTVPAVDFTNQLIKLDSNGNFVWKQNTGVSTNNQGCMLQHSGGYLYYQSGNLSVSKIDTAGVVGTSLSANYYSSPTASSGILFKGSGVFPNGDLMFAAYSRGTVAFGNDTLFHIGNPFSTAPFLFLRCDTNMHLIWAKYASNGRDPDNNFIPLAIDNNDNVYAGVQVNVEMIIGNDTIQSTAFTGQGAVIKLDGNGNGIWAKAFQSTGLAYAWCMQKAPDNSGIVIGGGYSGITQLGSFSLNGISQTLPFVAKFDGNGNYLNAFNYIQNLSQTDALSMSADENGNYYVGGKLPSSTSPVFSCTPAPGNRGFYLGSFTEQPDTVPNPTITVDGDLLTASPTFMGNIQWYLNGNILTGENNQTLIAIETGNYSVEYAYLTGCVGADTSQVLEVVISSIAPISNENQIHLYPNPIQASGIITISGTYKNDQLEITDIQGRLIKKMLINETNEIDLVGIQSGLYLVKAQGKVSRLIIQ
jgi:hypothetical protein